MITTKKQDSKLFILIFLGMLSAFGPFVMDMYLPTLPAMSDYFHTTSSMVQLGLTSSMVGLAIGQLIFGPLSDKYGRQRPLIIALFLFLFSTVGCIFSQNIMQFVVLRFVQGVAGAGGVVLSRSIATDKYSARELATMLAIIGAINGIAGKLGGLFKGSMVVGLTDVNLSSSGYGLSTNSVSSDNRTYNTFNVQGGAGQDVSNLARAIRREFDLGRA